MAKHCECPEEAVPSMVASMMGYEPEEEKARNHAPNECPGDYEVKQYRRGDDLLWLCSCCCLPKDVAILEGGE